MKFSSGYNIKIVVRKPWDGYNFGGRSLPGGISWWEVDNLQLVAGGGGAPPYPPLSRKKPDLYYACVTHMYNIYLIL